MVLIDSDLSSPGQRTFQGIMWTHCKPRSATENWFELNNPFNCIKLWAMLSKTLSVTKNHWVFRFCNRKFIYFNCLNDKKSLKTRMHSSMMRNARTLSYGRWGVSLTETPWTETPPWTESPLGQRPPGQRPPLNRDPPVNRITDRCTNITLPQLRCGR